MSTHPFLSPAWISSAIALRDEFASRLAQPEITVRMNLIVNQVPVGDADRVEAHVDTAAGMLPELGHLDDAEVTITLSYDDAKDLLVGQDPEAVTMAFMAGRIRIDGDVSRVFLLQAMETSAEEMAAAAELNERLVALTE